MEGRRSPSLAAAKAAFPSGAFAQGAGPETKAAKLGFIALTDAAPLFVAKEKGLFAKHGMPDVEVQKQASWGTTRDNLVLGSEGNGIDGAHILTPMPYLISAGKVTQNNVPTPMYILARLNLDGQCISVAKEYADMKVGLDTKPFKEALAEEEGRRQGDQGRHDLPGRHARSLDPLLARGRRHRSRQGHRDHRRAAAPDGGQHEGRHHGLLLRLRALERAAHPPEHRLHGDHHRGALEQAPGEGLRLRAAWVDKHPKAAKALLMAVMEAQQWCDKAREPRGGRRDLRQARNGSTCPVDDVTDRVKGRFDYGTGRVVEEQPACDEDTGADHASYPFQSHDLWFITEDMRWGKFEPNARRQGADRQGQSRGPLARGGKGARRPASEIPASTSRGKETFFDGKVFDPDNPTAYLAALDIKRVA